MTVMRVGVECGCIRKCGVCRSGCCALMAFLDATQMAEHQRDLIVCLNMVGGVGLTWVAPFKKLRDVRLNRSLMQYSASCDVFRGVAGVGVFALFGCGWKHTHTSAVARVAKVAKGG